jgi:hypothetical protein
MNEQYICNLTIFIFVQLAEKDGASSQLLTEKIQCQHQTVLLSGQRAQAETARKLAEQQVTVLQERVVALEVKLQVFRGRGPPRSAHLFILILIRDLRFGYLFFSEP